MIQTIPCKYIQMPVYYNTGGSPEPPGPGPGPDYSTMPLTFKAHGASTLRWDDTSTAYGRDGDVYKLNDGDWISLKWRPYVNLQDGDEVSFSGVSRVSGNSNIGHRFRRDAGTGTYDVYGNIASLVNFSNTVGSYEFSKSFSGFPVVDASNLVISFTNCNGTGPFMGMFSGCTSLTAGPLILAPTGLSLACYEMMFYNCSNMETGPSSLPANVGADECYYWMFYGCSKLKDAPEIHMQRMALWNQGFN